MVAIIVGIGRRRRRYGSHLLTLQLYSTYTAQLRKKSSSGAVLSCCVVLVFSMLKNVFPPVFSDMYRNVIRVCAVRYN